MNQDFYYKKLTSDTIEITGSKKTKKTNGYKVTNGDMTCRGFQYELGKLYEHKGKVSLCNKGFHFCQQAQHCFNYYDFTPENKVFEVEVSGTIEHGDDKSVCSEIKLIREIPWDEVLKIANTGANNTGRSNSGHSNSGHSNSGHMNSGNSNSGHMNSGNSNSGHMNSGNRNSGHSNSGHSNSGDMNSGNSNSGHMNSGNMNSGDRNSGDMNSGNSNSGHMNSGNMNSGNSNSGHSNSGNSNSGAFCTDADPVLYLFNKPTAMTVKEWENHLACKLMYGIDTTLWVPGNEMSKEEKENHPKWETADGYLKTISIKEAWANFWHNQNEKNKKVFTSLPNFDAKIFEEITGIKTN